jgi:hypothetical protein
MIYFEKGLGDFLYFHNIEKNGKIGNRKLAKTRRKK